MPKSLAPQKPVVFGHGHIGASKKREYEDRRFAGVIQTRSGMEITLAIVADGVGGGNLGQRAAQATVDGIVEYCQNSSDKDIPQMLGKAIGTANRKVYEEGSTHGDANQMSSTVAIAAVYNQKLYVANVGDSRVYLVRDNKVNQITVDHNWANEKIREGKLSPEEANRHPNANFLMRSVGYEPNVKVDLGLYLKNGTETGEESFRQQGLALGPNDLVLVCSDGLIKNRPGSRDVYVSPQEMLEVFERSNAEQAAKTLVDIAIGKNVDDNVTAVVVEMPGRKRKLLSIPRVQISALAAIIIAASLLVVLGGITILISSNRSTPAMPTPLPGSVYIVEGTLQSRQAGENAATTKTAGESVYFNPGTLVTAQDGDVTLSLPENYQVQLFGDPSSPAILELYQAPQPGESRGSMILKLRQGRMLAIAGGGANKNVDLIIETPNGQAIITGTILGAIYEIGLQEFLVDCFTGSCQLETSQAQQIITDGQHCSINVSGLINCGGKTDLAVYGQMDLARYIPNEILSRFLSESTPLATSIEGAPTFVSTATLFPTPLPSHPSATSQDQGGQNNPPTAIPTIKPSDTPAPTFTPVPPTATDKPTIPPTTEVPPKPTKGPPGPRVTITP